MTKRNKISLSSNATAFDAALALAETPVVETTVVETENVSRETVEEPTVEVVDTVTEPVVDKVEEPTEEAPVVRRHMTMGVARGERRNGIGAPAPNGKCHMAWRLFDGLTAYDGEALTLPALGDAIIAAQAEGYSPGNVRIEYPRWRKWNGFAAVARRAKVEAPVPVETVPAVEAPADATVVVTTAEVVTADA